MESKRSTWCRRTIVGGLALEIAIALVATLVKAGGSCGSCGGSPAHVAVGAVGAIFYAILLATALWAGPRPFLFVGILSGWTVHAALVMLMFTGGPVCPPCLLAAFVSLVLFGASLLYERENLKRAAWVLPAVAILLQAGSFAAGLAKAEALAQARSGLPPADALEDGLVRVVVLEDPNCPFCRALESDVLPEIEKEFGSRIRILRRSGSAVPGLALPTVIVVGRGEEVFEGLPTVGLLRAAIARARDQIEARPLSVRTAPNP